MEEINLNLGSPSLNVSSNNSAGTIKINIDDYKQQKSVNFGPGAEMLMNPKKNNSTSPRADINLSELNDIGDIDISDKPKTKRPSFTDVTSNIFGKPNNSPGITLKVDEPNHINPLKSATTNPKVETADGFKTFNEIPVAPSAPPPTPSLSAEETLREKLKILRKLEDLEKRGIQLTKKYSMDSSLAEMKGEYEMIKNEKEKKNSVKFQGKMLMACVSGLEFLNGRFDPFDLKLDGWSEAVNENIDEYDDVFGELHEKYGGKAKMSPEIKLLFMLGGSAAMLHMTNTMFKSSMPGMDDIMRQNPELMQQFQSAAMNSMNQNNPGFGQFMGGVMGGGGDGSGPMPPMGSPAMPTMEMRQNPPQMRRTRARPDVAASRRPQFNDAVDINDKYSRTPRPEMKGPSDLTDILSGLKTKKINIAQKDTNSVVSVSELNEMKNTVLEKPKKSRRKAKSERNTISLNFN
tara:strand:- start:793 stop:2178 length:1386 start_codon:yes stop_codon:yes gene_type:complete